MQQRVIAEAPAAAHDQAPEAPIDWAALLTPRQQRDRETILPQVMAVTNPDCIAHPQVLYLTDADLARRIVTENTQRLERACRVLSRRGQRDCWTYDLATHTAALEVLRRERGIAQAIGAAAPEGV